MNCKSLYWFHGQRTGDHIIECNYFPIIFLLVLFCEFNFTDVCNRLLNSEWFFHIQFKWIHFHTNRMLFQWFMSERNWMNCYVCCWIGKSCFHYLSWVIYYYWVEIVLFCDYLFVIYVQMNWYTPSTKSNDKKYNEIKFHAKYLLTLQNSNCSISRNLNYFLFEITNVDFASMENAGVLHLSCEIINFTIKSENCNA